MNVLLHDLRFAIRTLRRNPGYTLTALLTLVIGIGANVAVFSVVRGVLLSPLPFPEPGALVSITEENGAGNRMSVAWRNFIDWRDRQRSLESIGAYSRGGPATVLGLGQPIRVGVSRVSDGFFATLGVQPARGRVLLPEEHKLGGPPAVVVSDGFWRVQLGSDPSFADREIEVGGFRARIVGVMPPEFEFPEGVDIWAAIELNAQSESRTAHNFSVVGRLRPNTDAARVDADLDAITAAFLEEDPGAAAEDWFDDFFPRGASIGTLLESLVGETRRPLMILFGASFLVLLVACTNLASAMLARGTNREREYALRRSLGAGRGQMARHILTESLVLSLAGGALGVAFAAVSLRVVPTLAPAGIPRIDEIGLDGTVLLVALGVAIITSLLFGLLPALRVVEGGFADTLRSGSRGGQTRTRMRVWNGLIALEVALALTLLIGSGLLLRSFQTVLAVQPGFRTADVLTATLNPPTSRYPDGEARRRFFDAILGEITDNRVVANAGIISGPPMVGVSNGRLDIREGTTTGLTGDYQVASSGYFAAMDVPLLAGRLFDDRDRSTTPHVVVVNAAFAEAAWPGEDPLGKQITGGGMDDFWDQDRWATVIGVVGNIRQRDLTADPRPTAYFPYRQRPFRTWSMTIVAAPARVGAAAAGPALRDIVRRVDSDVPVNLSTIESRIATSLTPRRFTMLILAFFAVAALLLACVGIWGVVAYAVARRTREIGIRLALGADASAVRRLVQTGYLGAAGAGAAIGLILSVALTRVLRSLLYEVQPTDPLTMIAVTTTLAAAAWLASYFPARRSTGVSPMETMRSE
jgi:putative ABC transport system permease protein